MQVSQGFLVVEPGALRHEAFDELQHAAGAVGKPPEDLTRIGVDGAVATFIQQPLCFRGALRRREIEKRQEIARLIVGAGLLELRSSLCIDQGGGHVGEGIRGIAAGGMTLGLYKNCPTGFEATQRVV